MGVIIIFIAQSYWKVKCIQMAYVACCRYVLEKFSKVSVVVLVVSIVIYIIIWIFALIIWLKG
jgi:hypothetical protein